MTLDVVSLYTTTPCVEALRVAKSTLEKHRDDTIELLKNNHIVRMLSLVLRCNNFDFNGEHFLQIQDVAMGTRASPTIANLEMGDFEVKHVYTYHLKPLMIWSSFIDDNFMLWTHGLKALQDFVKHLNSCHPTPKCTFESSKVSIPMLDTTIIVGLHRKLYTNLYIKPTATYSYLHYSSCHPHHQKTGGPYSQLLRVNRNCAKNTDFEHYAHKTMGHYKCRGYPESVVQSAWNKNQIHPHVPTSHYP